MPDARILTEDDATKRRRAKGRHTQYVDTCAIPNLGEGACEVLR